jgi:NAD+ diphosphatase
MAPENLFAGAYLDRRAEARLRDDWLADARADPHTLYVCMHDSAALVCQPATDGVSHIAFLGAADPRIENTQDVERHVLLGWFGERRCVLVDLDPAHATAQGNEVFTELRPLAADLPPTEAGLLAYARALQLWRRAHRHCGTCGTLTHTTRAGHARHCPHCDTQSFPRLDPAIIVLVSAADHVLLGRQALWPPNRYSTIAGFVEPGESLEDAVQREVFEETGVTATDITYHSSQPWPFPSSLMLGFHAHATRQTPVLHDGELEDARWFSRAQIQSGAVLLPPAVSISRRLIDHWLADDA